MAKASHYKVSDQAVKPHKHNSIRPILSFAATILLILACNFPGVAQTAGTAETATSTSAAVASTATTAPTKAPTETPVPPSLSVSAAVPCLSGPGDTFERVVNLQAGEKAEITGKANGFWLVKTSDGSECWVADQGVTTEGEVAGVPDVDPPATPEPSAPAAPSGLQVIGARCSVDKNARPTMQVNEFHLSWQDNSNNEDGFRLFRDGNKVADLSADRTDVVDEIRARNNRTHFYYVVAYNAQGESKSEAIALTCEGAGSGGGGGGGGAPGPGPGPGP